MVQSGPNLFAAGGNNYSQLFAASNNTTTVSIGGSNQTMGYVNDLIFVTNASKTLRFGIQQMILVGSDSISYA